MNRERGRIAGIHLFVFSTGAAVMATEMCASRFLAPWFGTSMMVWSVLISVILGAMSLGYWTGGRLADRRPSWRLLYSLPLSAGVLVALIPPAGRFVFSGLTAGIMRTPFEMIALSFAGAALVFVPPVLILAMVSPFVIRLLAREGTTGRTAGSLYAVSTLGSIAGTLVPALGTIPLLGTRETMLLCSLVLVLLGLAGLSGRPRPVIAVLLVPAAAWLITSGPVRAGSSVVHEEETLYQYLQVQRRPDGSTVLIVNEGGGIQSIAREGDSLRPASTYYESYLLLPYMARPDDDPRILVIGSGAGTIPHLLSEYVRPAFPDMTIEAVELDGRAVELGFEWFGTEPGDARFSVADGRVFAERASHTWDIIISDTYSNQIYIPFHLATREYFQALKERLSPGGMVAMNVNAFDVNSALLQSVGLTLAEVFAHVYAAHVSDGYNFMLIASDLPLEPPSADSMARWNPALEETARLFEPLMEPLHPQGGVVLTDNRAPVEMMTDFMILRAAAEGIR